MGKGQGHEVWNGYCECMPVSHCAMYDVGQTAVKEKQKWGSLVELSRHVTWSLSGEYPQISVRK